MSSAERSTLIYCPPCRRRTYARNCPKRHGRKWILVNVCTTCGADYPAPSPEGRPVEDVVAERRGQLRLFT